MKSRAGELATLADTLDRAGFGEAAALIEEAADLVDEASQYTFEVLEERKRPA